MARVEAWCLGLVVGIGVCVWGQGDVRAGEGEGWSPKAAASYLDGRMTAWNRYDGAGRGEGATRTVCLSCHTSVPYFLGRSALRGRLGERQPLEFEDRIVTSVRLRVENWKELDTPRFALAYDFDSKKKVESRGTEAVLNALVLALDDARAGRRGVSDPAREAFRLLWGLQRTEGPECGSWSWLTFGNHPWEPDAGGEYFGSALAAIAVGLAPGYLASEAGGFKDGLDRLRNYLKTHRSGASLHHQLWAVWASTLVHGVMTNVERRALLERVLALQQADGGFNLAELLPCERHDGSDQDHGSDGYATGLTVYVARLAGYVENEPRLAKAQAWLRANQQESGAWLAQSLNKKRDARSFTGKFMSDAATAFAVMALALDQKHPPQ